MSFMQSNENSKLWYRILKNSFECVPKPCYNFESSYLFLFCFWFFVFHYIKAHFHQRKHEFLYIKYTVNNFPRINLIFLNIFRSNECYSNKHTYFT